MLFDDVGFDLANRDGAVLLISFWCGLQVSFDVLLDGGSSPELLLPFWEGCLQRQHMIGLQKKLADHLLTVWQINGLPLPPRPLVCKILRA